LSHINQYQLCKGTAVNAARPQKEKINQGISGRRNRERNMDILYGEGGSTRQSWTKPVELGVTRHKPTKS